MKALTVNPVLVEKLVTLEDVQENKLAYNKKMQYISSLKEIPSERIS